MKKGDFMIAACPSVDKIAPPARPDEINLRSTGWPRKSAPLKQSCEHGSEGKSRSEASDTGIHAATSLCAAVVTAKALQWFLIWRASYCDLRRFLRLQ
jgi:hypothetical protein